MKATSSLVHSAFSRFKGSVSWLKDLRRGGWSVVRQGALAVATLALCLPAPAANITWGAATNITGDSNVSTAGTLLGAFNLGAAGVSTATVNAVTFNGLAISGTSVTSGNFTLTGDNLTGSNALSSGSNPFAGLSTNYKTLLSSIGGNDSNPAPNTPNPLTLTMSGLTVGATYQFQSWYDLSAFGVSFNSTLTGGANSVVLNNNTTSTAGGLGQFVTGTFVADATSQSIVVTVSGFPASNGINAFQLRDLSRLYFNGSTLVFGSAAAWNTSIDGGGAGTAPDSTKDIFFSTTTPSPFFSTTVLTAPTAVRSVTFLNTSNSITISGLALTIGAGGVTVEDGAASHTIAASVVLGTSQTWYVGAGAGDLIVSGVVSDGGNAYTLTKTGDGRLIFTSPNTYSGGTNVNGGVLIIQNDGSSTFGQLGSGTTTVNGATTAGGSYGTLIFQGNNASAGTGVFVVNPGAANLADGGHIEFNDASTAGTGNFTVKGETAHPDAIGYVNFHDSSTAGAATFSLDGGNMNFDDTANAGTAQFTVNGQTSGGAGASTLSFSFNDQVNGAASASGATITVNGATLSNTGVGGNVNFWGKSTAGDSSAVFATFLINGASVTGAGGGKVTFNNESSAAYANLTVDGGSAANTFAGNLDFNDSATADHATIIVNAGTVATAQAGAVHFNGTATPGIFSTAGNASITVNGSSFAGDFHNGDAGAYVVFQDNSTAGAATLMANAGTGAGLGGGIFFIDDSLGGTSTIKLNGSGTLADTNGRLDISLHNPGGVSIGSLEGGGDVYLGGNTLAVGGNNSPTTFSGTINDGGYNGGTGGSFTKEGSGTLILSGISTYTGKTIVEGGTLEVQGSIDTTSEVYVGNTTSGNTFKITSGGSVTDSTALLGVGVGADGNSAIVTGPGSKWATTGDLNVGFQGKDNSLEILDGGLVTSNNVLIGANPSSTGNTVKVDGTGSIFNVAGTLHVGYNANDNTLNISNGGAVDVTGAMVVGRNGTGNLVTVSSGGNLKASSITLGQNAGSSGTLQIGTGGAAGTVDTPTITGGAGSGEVNFNHSDIDLDFAPVISGNITVNQNGPGSTIFSGAHTYTGNTNINGGTLYVDGSIASPETFVNPGGTLGGNGVIFGNVTNNGIVSPGHSPGTLTVMGNYTQPSGGTLVIEIASSSSFDKLVVGGHASLGGKLQIVALNGYQPKLGDHLVFLTAGGGISGKFSTTDNPFLGSLVRLDVSYGANEVSLDGVQNSFTNAFGITKKKTTKAGSPVQPTSVFGITPNQISVALALDGALYDSRQAGVLEFLNNVPFANVPHHLDQIAPEELTSIYTLGFAQLDAEVLSIQQRLSDIRLGLGNAGMGDASNIVTMDKGSPKVQMPNEDRYGFFLTETGDFASAGDTYNANGFNIQSAGTTLGLDVAVGDHLILGLSLGYARTDTDLIDDGHMTVDGGRAALYAMYHAGGFYTEGLIGGGYGSYDIKRSGLQGSAFSSPNGGELGAYLGTGYDFRMGQNTIITPMGSLLYSLVGLKSFEETGSLEPLAYPSQHESSLRSRFGLRAATTFKVKQTLVTPSFSAEWQHEFLDEELGVTSGFANGAGTSFIVEGPALGRDSALLTGAVNVTWSRYAAYVAYQADLGRENYEKQTVLVGLRVSW